MAAFSQRVLPAMGAGHVTQVGYSATADIELPRGHALEIVDFALRQNTTGNGGVELGAIERHEAVFEAHSSLTVAEGDCK